MELTDATFWALAIPAVIFAGVSKAGFGSGAAFAATPILALVVDPATALGVMLPLLMLVDLATLRPYWGQWHMPSVRLIALGALPGVALGAGLYEVAPADLFRFLIGAVAVGFVAFQMAVRLRLLRYRAEPFSREAGLVAGLLAGFTSFISHAGGPPVAIYLLAQGMGKTTYQASTVLIFWLVNIYKFVPYALLGIFTGATLRADLLLAPFALLGAWLGVRAHRLVPEGLFFAITYVLLTVTGTKLIWDSLS
ncbi:putative membrane protein YfcA [Rhodovulum iodosum]|uniref:Probable membrane transporter protein n=1 Tax=Rhodovulum iodosum TaxID=68291 RepID=A0ABV3XSD0_9RHOB|nr:sulfite exporter TauE/SafE family protein [Rhodovulum robiginosum]RSK30564.1 sulfite exporter TauE/SafE family protein [Rhodovulum robiginosum]